MKAIERIFLSLEALANLFARFSEWNHNGLLEFPIIDSYAYLYFEFSIAFFCLNFLFM